MTTEKARETKDCRRFTGYKPCEPFKVCENCCDREPFGKRVLLIGLDALGAVIQATSLLPAMHREWGRITVTWVTMPGNIPALAGNPLIWKVMPYNFETVSILGQMEFDIVVSLDKAPNGCALAESVKAQTRLGFGLSAAGQIAPFNAEAEELYNLGLDDELKFRKNDKYGTQLLAEAIGLEWKRDPYILQLTDEEKGFVEKYRQSVNPEKRTIIGYNTGCSTLFPNKKMTVEQHVYIIKRINKEHPQALQVLLGGKAETERNREIAQLCEGMVSQTPTTEGLRRGIMYIAACDMVVTGDTSGLHMAIGLGKYSVSWFGLSCASEIDMYDRGVKILADMECSPCWKKACDNLRCVNELDLDRMVREIETGIKTVGADRAVV